jgi:hypothetical protein
MNPKEPIMTDRLLLATLTLSVLVTGAWTTVSALFDGAAHTPMRVVQLEPVLVTAKRLAPPAELAATERVAPIAPRAQ